MGDHDTKETGDENVADTGADNSSVNTRPSAIERQITAMSALRPRKQSLRNSHHDNRRLYRFGLVGFLVLILLVAIGLVWVSPDFGRPLQKAFNAISQLTRPPAATRSPAAATKSSPTTNLLASAPPQAVAPKTVAEVATPAAISIPVADVSLRNRPELLEQLVQVYRAQLAADPNDSKALVALKRLQEQSLSDLEAIFAAGDDATTAQSLAVVSRVFPELVNNPRYKYLLARMDHLHSEAKTETTAKPAAEPELSTPSARAIDTSIAVTKKATEKAAPQKPQIRVLSITPGTMVERRFVPSADGNVFMVEISYRYFERTEDQSEAALVARLGIPGDPTVLAEAPVDVVGDRGTKSFAMETLMPGNTGGKYQLNFMLNGEFLASRTLRLSVPGQ